MQPKVPAKRPVCRQCQRPEQTCICHWIRPTIPGVEVLILQHPLEVSQAKGSARLLHLSLQRSRLVVGESFDQESLRNIMYGPLLAPCTDYESASCIQPVLLYPRSLAMAPDNFLPNPVDSAIFTSFKPVRLVILDGTWRKSRKMLALNPLLQLLPRLSLEEMPASRYTVRKAHLPDQLSTLEAACYALMQLEGNHEKYAPLLQAFIGFVKQQADYLEGRLQTQSEQP